LLDAAGGLGEDSLTDLAPARQRFARFADRVEGGEDREATAPSSKDWRL